MFSVLTIVTSPVVASLFNTIFFIVLSSSYPRGADISCTSIIFSPETNGMLKCAAPSVCVITFVVIPLLFV